MPSLCGDTLMFRKSKRIKQLELEVKLLRELLNFYIELNKLNQLMNELAKIQSVKQNYIPVGMN